MTVVSRKKHRAHYKELARSSQLKIDLFFASKLKKSVGQVMKALEFENPVFTVQFDENGMCDFDISYSDAAGFLTTVHTLKL